MNILNYLERIGFTGVVRPDLDTLIQLQQLHLFAVPFEDIDIQLSIPIILEPEPLYHKIIRNKRGGYCYELNGLFCSLLNEIGFEACLVSGRITKGKNTGPEYDHTAIIISLEGSNWLVDVGYGDFSLKPILLEDNMPQYDGRNHYCIKQHKAGFYSVGKLKAYDNRFHSEYLFSLIPHKLNDFKAMNFHKQRSANSHFTKNLICSLPMLYGRTSLINQRLIQTVGDIKTDTHLEVAEVALVLEAHFGINVTQHFPNHLWKFKSLEMSIAS